MVGGEMDRIDEIWISRCLKDDEGRGEQRGENARRQHLTTGRARHVTAGVRVSKPGLKVKQKEKDNETASRLA